MKKLTALLIFLLFLILAWLSWNWYKSTVVCCPEAPVVVEYGPLIFDCASDDPIVNDLWPEQQQAILSGRKPGKKLLIVGPYFGSENESQGLARANKLRSLFAADLTDDDMVYAARNGGDCESTKTNFLHEAQFKWVTRNDDVMEHYDSTIVHYRYDSDEEVTNENTGAYFNELAEALKASGDSIMITGHTDSQGEEDYNTELGLKRANEFRDHLISLGVDENQIQVESKGESQPVADNETEEGRKANRRVEIHITKN